MKNKAISLIECPRDAMQGIKELIPTEKKIRYLQSLLAVGFDTIDFGSFVSPKAIPQMADTAEVLAGLDLRSTKSKLLAIIANERGAKDAAQHEAIDFLGYPFSVSETFQMRNTNATIAESLGRVERIQNIAVQTNKKLVVYLSMGFGNPYGDEWNPEIVANWSEKLHLNFGIDILALSDTVGVAEPSTIKELFSSLIPALPNVEFGAHLHVNLATFEGKLSAAYEAGCRRFDGAIKGFGGCPMANDDLTGNMPTELMLDWLHSNNVKTTIDKNAFQEALSLANHTFPIINH